MEVTKREILISLTILGIMVGLGVWISSPIISAATEGYFATVSSTVVDTEDKFDYIRRTEVGRFIADGTLTVIDPVSLEELPKSYSYIKKVKEEYRLHTETYTTTDSKGHVTTHTRTYHSWDEVKHWEYKSERAMFLGKEFKYTDVFRYQHNKDTIIKADTKWYDNDTRYVYYTGPTSFEGCMTGIVEGKQYKDAKFRNELTSQDLIDRAETGINGTRVIFWLLWFLLTAGLITGFYALENRWLY